MILIELTAAVDASGTLQTFYLSTDSFVTAPADTPANTAFIPCLISPGSLGMNAYSDGRTGGATRLETGEIVIANVDGQFDAWLNHSFDGRPVVIRSGTSGAYPGAYPAVLTGTVESLEADWRKLTIRLRDKQWLLQLPALTTLYAGNNSLPNGLEGVAGDLKGKPKPKVYGTVSNISPPFINTSKLTYQVSNGAIADIAAVYDRGVLITKGADYATSALLQAAAPGAGTYLTCFAEGYFRLGTTPAGQITADVVQGAAAGNRTVAQIINALALSAGLASGEISSADVAALDSANASVVGIWLDGTVTFQAAMDQLAASVGAWYGFDAAGVLRMGRLEAPSGTPAVTLRDYDIHDGIERRPLKDHGVPVWRSTVKHSRLFTVQPSDLAGAVTAVTRAYLAEEYRDESSEDAAVKTQWLLSAPLSIDTLLTAAADAATEAARLLALHKVRRDLFDVPVTLDVLTANRLKLMDVVSVQLARFGMDSGKSFRLIGIRVELDKARVILSLWG